MDSDNNNTESQHDKKTGYGNPPASSRFRPGQSGNPKGRPKGSLNIQTVLMSTLSKKITINENGKRRQVTKFEAAFMQMVNKAASGDLRALGVLIDLAREAQDKQNAQSAGHPVPKAADKKIMARILQRFQTQVEAENLPNEENQND